MYFAFLIVKDLTAHNRITFIKQSSSNLFGASRDRTDDPLLAKQMLSQLSYGPFLPLGLGGLEPPTPRLSSVCSNQLSYRPVRLALVMHSR